MHSCPIHYFSSAACLHCLRPLYSLPYFLSPLPTGTAMRRRAPFSTSFSCLLCLFFLLLFLICFFFIPRILPWKDHLFSNFKNITHFNIFTPTFYFIFNVFPSAFKWYDFSCPSFLLLLLPFPFSLFPECRASQTPSHSALCRPISFRAFHSSGFTEMSTRLSLWGVWETLASAHL